MKRLVPSQESSHLLRFVVAFASIIVTWAMVHDLHLMAVEPRHFTEFHPPLLDLKSPPLLAAQYAVVATSGPALAFGFFAYFACRSVPLPKVSLLKPAVGLVAVLIIIEMLLRWMGHHARVRWVTTHTTMLPAILFPERTPDLVYTQTINLAAYLIAPLSGALYLLAIWGWRKRA
jgi:hypothetical protein